jgi:aldehyde:ferredoxin oxidoreductase
MKSKGLGDTISKISKATGIKKIVDTVAEATNSSCGCDERQSLLNKWFPYKGSLTEQEHLFLKNFFDKYNGTTIQSYAERDELLAISNRVFNKKDTPSNCSRCVKQMVANLRKEFQKYETN